MDRLNHGLLILARKTRAMTQGELATKISLAQGTLSKYETGMLDPTDDIVEEIARTLGFPIPHSSIRTRNFTAFRHTIIVSGKKLSAKGTRSNFGGNE